LAKFKSIITLAIFAVGITTTTHAQPRHRHHRHVANQIITCDDRGCSDRVNGRHASAKHAYAKLSSADDAYDSVIVGGRPPGCPREFCGCEASRYLFGEIRPKLNVAWNWARAFPRTAPAPGMAAVRRHHVMVLMQHITGDDWLVHDGNSGGARTREHVVSIRGYIIVDPHGSRVVRQADNRSN
jgi:hypothetical protein